MGYTAPRCRARSGELRGWAHPTGAGRRQPDRQYVFRSVDKDVRRGLPDDLRDTPIHAVVQDQTSAKHPAGALVVAPLLEAVGVLHANPALYMMPDDSALGPFRSEFGGRYGLLEERPTGADESTQPFAGAARVIGTERLLERVEEDTDHRVDARDYLTVRLMDLLVGDADRHADQYRWARYDQSERHVYRPIPRDRDNALVRHGGLLLDAARKVTTPKWTHFDEHLTHVRGLTLSGRELDRRILAELPKAVWDSTAASIKAHLTDEVIERAVAALPPEIGAREGSDLARALQSRRDQLPRAAAVFYRQLSRVVEVHATDKADRLEVNRRADGTVEVRLSRMSRPAEPYFQRVLRPKETEEVRVWLQGGDDHAVVRGERGALGVHILGGGGDDVLADSTGAGTGPRSTFFYDHRGDNRFTASARTHVDPRSHTPSAATVRDQGKNHSMVPYADYNGNVGVILGAGSQWTHYGFRYDPYASRVGIRGEYAIGEGFAVQATGDFRQRNRPTYLTLFGRASQIERLRFHGYGNHTPGEHDSKFYLVSQDQITADALVNHTFGPGEQIRVGVGPIFAFTRTNPAVGSPLAELRRSGDAAFGSDAVGQLGARGLLRLDRRDKPAFPMRGMYLRADAAAYPAVWGDAGAFGKLAVQGRVYLPFTRGAYGPTLALRLGGERIWGDFPVQEAAFIGGRSTLRGYSRERFAGDVSLYAGADLRAKITDIELITRGRLGATVLADAGRLWYQGESPGGLHAAVGGGIWFATLERPYVGSATFVRGEPGRGGKVYLALGLPF